MAITKKKPPVKQTVGAQYICFNTQDAEGEWTENFDAAVTKLPTVVDEEVSDSADSYESYASGAVYDSDTDVQYKEIAVTQIAFDDALIAKMRGDTAEDGVIISGGRRERPYFAYGIPIIKKGFTSVMRWYPKCKLIENSDRTATSADSHSDQTDTITIRAYPYNDNKDIDVSADTSATKFAELTEDAFFAAPLLTKAAVDALVS